MRECINPIKSAFKLSNCTAKFINLIQRAKSCLLTLLLYLHVPNIYTDHHIITLTDIR